MDHLAQRLEIDVTHMAVELVYRNWAVSDVSIVFRRVLVSNCGRTETVEVVDSRDRPKKGSEGSWAAYDTFPILDDERTASLVEAGNQN